LGRSEDALAGSKLPLLVHPDDHTKAQALWQGFAEGDYPRGVDLRIRRNDETIVCICSFAPLLDADGVIIISFQDVTEQRRTEAELVKTMEFLESLIDASVDGIIASDMRGNIILFNPSAE